MKIFKRCVSPSSKVSNSHSASLRIFLGCGDLAIAMAASDSAPDHTDAEREYAYDRQSHFGRLDVALDAAAVNKWMVVDMKKDWKVIFPFEKR